MDLLLRKAKPADAAALDKVMLVISDAPADLTQSAAIIEKIAACDDRYLLAAVDQETGVLCGSLLGVVFEDISSNCRPILLVENVAVLPEYQQKGVGRAMFAEIERWGHQKDCRYVMLVSGPERVGAHRFYEAIGYEEKKGFKKYF